MKTILGVSLPGAIGGGAAVGCAVLLLGRALDVMSAYLRHARQLDQVHSMAGTTPIETRLLGYSSVRGLVSGRYGEASADVHSLIAAAASARASRVWRRWGGRTESEVRSGIVASMRRICGGVLASL